MEQPEGSPSGVAVRTIKMYYVYILKSLKDNKHYIGSTSDINRRLKEHNRGKVKSTRYRIPFKLIYLEKFKDKPTANKREYYLKSPKGFLEKKRILKNIIARWSNPKGPLRGWQY